MASPGAHHSAQSPASNHGTPASTGSSNQHHPHTKDAPHKHQLNCERCRKRKTKCDRAEGGCSACLRAGVTCVVIDRPRLPRGRNGGRRKQDTELRARLARLEDLVKTFAPSSEEAAAIVNAHSHSPDQRHDDGKRDLRRGSATSSPSRTSSDMRRYLGSSFWHTLSTEIHGISDVLYDSSEDEEVTTPDSFSALTANKIAAPKVDLFLADPDSFMYNPAILELPDTESALALCDVFIYRFLPMYPIVHIPSLRRYMSGQEDYLEHPPGDPAVRALSFAIFYAAIMTLSPQECLDQFNVDQASALHRYKFATEVSLAQADLHRTHELATLQAFLLYLVTLRGEDSSRKSWTLAALAIRIAHALRLHNDDYNMKMRPFDCEMRRRVWHDIRRIDIQTAFDRGTYPCLSNNTMVPLPLNINDTDFDYHTEEPLQPREGFTNMTHFLCCIDGIGVATTVDFGLVGDDYRARLDPYKLMPLQSAAKPSSTVKSDFAAALKYLEETYLNHCDQSVDLQYMTVLMGKLIFLQKTLFAARPMRKDIDSSTSLESRDEEVFVLALEICELAVELLTSPRLVRWKWNRAVHWHSLGVVLAKLCVQPNHPLADRAWKAAPVAYREYSTRVADSEKGMLWKPLEKLMNRARQVRMEARVAAANGQNQQQPGNGLPTAATAARPEAISHNHTLSSSSVQSNSLNDISMTMSRQRLPTSTTIDSQTTAAALPTDFDMLSFQDPSQNWSNMTLDPFGAFDGLQSDMQGTGVVKGMDDGMLGGGNSWDWGTFVDDMNVHFSSDNFDDITFAPMMPAHTTAMRMENLRGESSFGGFQ